MRLKSKCFAVNIFLRVLIPDLINLWIIKETILLAQAVGVMHAVSGARCLQMALLLCVIDFFFNSVTSLIASDWSLNDQPLLISGWIISQSSISQVPAKTNFQGQVKTGTRLRQNRINLVWDKEQSTTCLDMLDCCQSLQSQLYVSSVVGHYTNLFTLAQPCFVESWPGLVRLRREHSTLPSLCVSVVQVASIRLNNLTIL